MTVPTRTGPAPKAWRVWAPAAIWAAAIFTMSAIPGRALPPLPGLNSDKLVHAAVYAVLGVLALRGVRGTSRAGAAAALLLAIALATVYGATDELHQLFVPGRMADPQDLAADAVGALVGVLTSTLIAGRRRARDR